MIMGDRVYVACRTSRFTACVDTGFFLLEKDDKVAYIIYGAVRVAERDDVFGTEDQAQVKVKTMTSDPVTLPANV